MSEHLKTFFAAIEKIRVIVRTFPEEAAEHSLRILAVLEELDWRLVNSTKDFRDRDAEKERLKNECQRLKKEVEKLQHDVRRLKDAPETWRRTHALSRLEKNRLRRQRTNVSP